MAARAAGYDPDRDLTSQTEESSGFAGPAWRHPKFVAMAEAAYAILATPPFPDELR
jgi:hypothetical protein